MTALIEMLRGQLVAIFRAPLDLEAMIDRAENLYAQGIHFFEVTVEGPHREQGVARLVEASSGRFQVAAGTVTTPAQLEAARSAGAAFSVSPGISIPLLEHAQYLEFMHVPGVVTPSEVQGAVDVGVTLVKLFPAGPLGPSYLKAVQAPFPNVRFMVTGGISLKDAQIYLDAGAHCVGLGSLVSGEDASGKVRELVGVVGGTP